MTVTVALATSWISAAFFRRRRAFLPKFRRFGLFSLEVVIRSSVLANVVFFSSENAEDVDGEAGVVVVVVGGMVHIHTQVGRVFSIETGANVSSHQKKCGCGVGFATGWRISERLGRL